MLLPRGRALPAALLPIVLAFGSPASGATIVERLRAVPRPHFRKGHTLPPLGRWGWSLPLEARVELAEHWGYTLEMGEANAALVKALDDPNSVPSKLVKLAAADPKRYPLCVLVHRAPNRRDFRESLPAAAWCVDPKSGKKAWSPEAPLSVFERAAREAVEPVAAIREKAPIALLLNGGEYALSVYGHHGKIWGQDRRVLEAKGDRPWFDYISERKAAQEAVVSNAVRKASPDRTLYIYYYADGCPHRGRYGHWNVWAWDYKHMRAVSDLPSSSIYYRHFNSGWAGGSDMLTQALNAAAQQIALGDPLSYNWLNAGWTRKKLGDEAHGHLARYAGFLKCWYAAGMLGGAAGYFAYPKGGFRGGDGPEAPHWLRQMIILARVHALFSHLEDFLRHGDLLPGPHKHRWSKDLPACEFPTGDPTARVVARKHRARREWLLAAWAAAGPARAVTVTIPALGKITLHAHPSASVYRAVLKDGKPELTTVDKNGGAPPAEK